jgi:hypothetical protein
VSVSAAIWAATQLGSSPQRTAQPNEPPSNTTDEVSARVGSLYRVASNVTPRVHPCVCIKITISWNGRHVPAFRKNLSPPSSVLKELGVVKRLYLTKLKGLVVVILRHACPLIGNVREIRN